MSSRKLSSDGPPSGVFSMTGYAHRASPLPLGQVTIELRSVNSRFTDLQFRLADEVRELEPRLRQAINAVVRRGKIECRVQLRNQADASGRIGIDEALIGTLARADARIRQLAPQAAALTVADYLHWPGVNASGIDEPGQAWSLVEPDFMQTLAEFVASREREGASLRAIILNQVDDMRRIVAELTPLVPALLAGAQSRLTVRLEEAMAGITVHGVVGHGSAVPRAAVPIPAAETFDRIRQEVALLGLRGDVSEEIDRLSLHLVEVTQCLQRGGAVGKRLDFLSQELNREVNTIASKANGIAVTEHAVALKLLIEQMREQVQNIE